MRHLKITRVLTSVGQQRSCHFQVFSCSVRVMFLYSPVFVATFLCCVLSTFPLKLGDWTVPSYVDVQEIAIEYSRGQDGWEEFKNEVGLTKKNLERELLSKELPLTRQGLYLYHVEPILDLIFQFSRSQSGIFMYAHAHNSIPLLFHAPYTFSLILSFLCCLVSCVLCIISPHCPPLLFLGLFHLLPLLSSPSHLSLPLSSLYLVCVCVCGSSCFSP